MVVAGAGQLLGLLETLGFADCALEGPFGGFDLVVTHAGSVFRDEVCSGGFWDSGTYSFCYSFGDFISAYSGIVSHKCGRFSARDCKLGSFLGFYGIGSWTRIIDYFVKGFVGRLKYCYFFIIFRLKCMWIVLNNKGNTSDGPGCAFVLNIYLFYLGTVNYLLDWNFGGWGV